MYLLDTCAVIDIIRRDVTTVNRLKSYSPNEVMISSITELELRYGLLISPDSKSVELLDRMLSDFTILSFGTAEANQAAQIRSLLKKQGQPIGPYDVLIGATAATHDLTLVTSNAREFNRIPHLKVENWRNS